MTKYILVTLLAVFVGFSFPTTTEAASAIEIIEPDTQQPTVTPIEGSVIRVTNANGQMLYIYNIAGVRIQAIKVDGMDKTIDLNLPKGCYIVKVGKTVRKIYVR